MFYFLFFKFWCRVAYAIVGGGLRPALKVANFSLNLKFYPKILGSQNSSLPSPFACAKLSLFLVWICVNPTPLSSEGRADGTSNV